MSSRSRSDPRPVPAPARTRVFAWCGLTLHLPDKWRPVKIEGGERQGTVIFADLERARLGLRWQTPADAASWYRRVKFVPDAGVNAMLKAEAGDDARRARPAAPHAGRWEPGRLVTADDVPGRDLWVGYSPVTGRVVQLSYQARRRDTLLEKLLLPSLADTPVSDARRWALFDFSCSTPAGYRLTGQRLGAGDVRLAFVRTAGRLRLPLVVRQTLPATLCLAREPLDQWLYRFSGEALRFHRRSGRVEPSGAGPGDRPTLAQPLVRRRRYFWLRTVPRRLKAVARHDRAGDRLYFVRAADPDVLGPVLASMADR